LRPVASYVVTPIMNASIEVAGRLHHPDCLAARYRDQAQWEQALWVRSCSACHEHP